MKKKQNNKLLIVIVVILLILALVGGSYAFFTAIITGSDNTSSIKITTETLTLTYNGNMITTGSITQPNESFTSKFTVENTSNTIIPSYNISFTNVVNNVLNNEYVYNLTCTSYLNYGTGSQVVNGTCSGKGETPIPTVAEAVMMTSSPINPGITHEYTFKVTFKDIGVPQDYNQGKNATFKLIIE